VIRTIGFAALLVLVAGSPAMAAGEWSGNGLLGIKIAVKDMPRAIDFYTKLGMTIGRLYHPDGNEIEMLGPPAK